MRKITRRSFFALLAGGGTALGTHWLRGRSSRRFARELPNVLPPGAYTQMIGRQYLRKVPEEADPDRLGELILSDLPWNAAIETDPQVLVRELVRRDFAEDRVVRLGQWLLSQTEARLCALTALANQTS